MADFTLSGEDKAMLRAYVTGFVISSIILLSFLFDASLLITYRLLLHSHVSLNFKSHLMST